MRILERWLLVIGAVLTDVYVLADIHSEVVSRAALREFALAPWDDNPSTEDPRRVAHKQGYSQPNGPA